MSNGRGKTLYKCISEGKGGEEGGINGAIAQSINQSINTYARISD